MKNKVYRQGDVLIIQVEALPPDLKKVKPDKGRNILAYGEVTGHAHAIDIKEAKFLETEEGVRYLQVLEKAYLKHEEHHTIELPAGDYRIIQQVEYQKEFRPVVD
jgi:hypothetical protein